ncbi:hypothetical protein [Companilactobacillus formosensis]|uniref:hypothetical protein n=1 Tax=Companilactobacillus formosensis TaxID=1617889 RepID=UPI0006EE2F36|nr:hypothetical protein [Companilactobacillus formosensis]GAQ02109.1 hypothetical protein NBRC111452_1950 [Companilactobacillus farciminis]
MSFNRDFYKVKYFWIGILGLSFLLKFPWEDVCSIKGIAFLIIVVTGLVSVVSSVFNFSKYFS